MAEVAPAPILASVRPERQKLDWLQCGRAIAATSVCCFHASERVAKHAADLTGFHVFQFGKLGVDLFFVISGFIIFYIHAGDIGRPATLERYAYRRATRIYPLYWLLFALVIPLYFVVPSAGDGTARDLGSLIRCFFLLPNVPGGQVIGVAWTLVFEVSFYAIFALLILNRWIGTALIAVWAGLIVANTAGIINAQGYAAPYLSPRYFEFAVGAGVYYLSQRWRPRWALVLSAASAVLLFAGGLVWPALAAALSTLTSQVLLAGLLCGAIVFGLVTAQGSSPKASRAGRILTALGDASYSIYLSHWLIGWIVDKAFLKLHQTSALVSVIYFPILCALMIGGGYLVHRVIERRLMNFFNTVWRRRTEAARQRRVQPAV